MKHWSETLTKETKLPGPCMVLSLAVATEELSTLIQYAELICSVLFTHVKCPQELLADTCD